MLPRSERTRDDRAFNLACQILCFAARGQFTVGKKELRGEVRASLGLKPLSELHKNYCDGDMRATGDASNHAGLTDLWQLDDSQLFLTPTLLERCRDFLSKTPESSRMGTDLFDKPFIVSRRVEVRGVGITLSLSRLEDGLTAGCLHTQKEVFWFFVGKLRMECFSNNVFITEEDAYEALSWHRANSISHNPTGNPLTKEAASYVSQMKRMGHIRYPFIRSSRFVVRATIVNAKKLDPIKLAACRKAVDLLNSWTADWATSNDFNSPENFADLIRRTFPQGV